MWYGPFQPTGGANEDSNSPLGFIHGLWYHINNNNYEEENEKKDESKANPPLPSKSPFLRSFRGNNEENHEEEAESETIVNDDDFDQEQEEEEEMRMRM